MSMMTDLIGYGRSEQTRGSADPARRYAAIWLSAARERRALADLPDSILADIGISRAEAEREARRPFWDVRPRR